MLKYHKLYSNMISTAFSEYDTDEIPTYEEVEMFYPKYPLRLFRPIVFIGMYVNNDFLDPFCSRMLFYVLYFSTSYLLTQHCYEY